MGLNLKRDLYEATCIYQTTYLRSTQIGIHVLHCSDLNIISVVIMSI